MLGTAPSLSPSCCSLDEGQTRRNPGTFAMTWISLRSIQATNLPKVICGTPYWLKLQAALHGKAPQVQAPADESPKPLREFDGHYDGDEPQGHQIPGAKIAEELGKHVVKDGADQRAFDGAESADDDHEDDHRRPMHAEGGIGRDAQVAQEIQGAGNAEAKGGDDIDPEFCTPYMDSLTFRRHLTVADRGQCEAETRPQEKVYQGNRAEHRRHRDPERDRLARGLRDTVQRGETRAGAAAQHRCIGHEQAIDLGDGPGADGEIAAL